MLETAAIYEVRTVATHIHRAVSITHKKKQNQRRKETGIWI